jgi:hypothetical protein
LQGSLSEIEKENKKRLDSVTDQFDAFNSGKYDEKLGVITYSCLEKFHLE